MIDHVAAEEIRLSIWHALDVGDVGVVLGVLAVAEGLGLARLYDGEDDEGRIWLEVGPHVVLIRDDGPALRVLFRGPMPSDRQVARARAAADDLRLCVAGCCPYTCAGASR